MAWSDPRTWVVGEVVTAAQMNAHVRDQFLAIGKWEPGDLKLTYVTHANATTATLTEPQTGWYIANGATISAGTDPNLYAAIGSVTTLPDWRDRMFVAPGAVRARGASGGTATVALATAELPVHTHAPTDPGHTHGVPVGDSWANNQGGAAYALNQASITSLSSTTGITIGNAGSGTAHENMPPFRVGGMVLIKR